MSIGEVSGDRSAQAPYHPRDIAGDEAGVANPKDAAMLWAASTMCFFGFLRSGEVVVAGGRRFDPTVHLVHGDVRVNSYQTPGADQGIQNRPLSRGGYNLPGQGSWRIMPSSCGFGLHGRSRHPTGPVLQVY